MTIAPTVSGGLKLIPEEDQDWVVLLKIAHDGDGDLAQHFAGLMDEDSMWEDIVVPELESEFSTQRKKVLKDVMEARERKSDGLIIDRKDAEIWYGAFNQARLAMEEKYRFGPREFRDSDDFEDEEMRSAYFRNEFYGTVQSLLLEYVMVDD